MTLKIYRIDNFFIIFKQTQQHGQDGGNVRLHCRHRDQEADGAAGGQGRRREEFAVRVLGVLGPVGQTERCRYCLFL